MNQVFRQEDRIGRLTTVLGPDALVLLRFGGVDRLNDLFEYEVEALSTDPAIDFDALLGTHATVEIDTGQHGPQPFDGIVTQAAWAGTVENGNRYRLILRPWFWLCGRRRNQRIFHERTVVEILQDLLQPYAGLGDPHVENRLQAEYRALEYTVQYRESDLNFATRLMERFGITWHFRHAAGSHTLVLTDAPEAHDTVPGGARPYRGVDRHHQAEEEHFWEWARERSLTTGAIRLTDWNFKTPAAAMEADQLGDARYAQGGIESFDWPGDYLDRETGRRVARLRTDQERAQDRRFRAVGDCASLRSGMRLRLTGEPLPWATGEDHLCLEVRHAFVSQSYGSGGARSDGYTYSGSCLFAPESAPLAPERITPRPIVHGPQTAVVVGEGEIDCDEYGRILVRFHWDLDNAWSMRCRVSQSWASKGWGGMVIPRIGMEVVVEFLEGDPDQPLVTGCVYNGRNTVPYDLPAHKTRSTFKTKTHQGTGFNELRFEDKTAEEEIRVIAEKDLNVLVKNNEAKIVYNDSAEAVFDNKLTEVFGNQINSVSGSMTIYTGPGGPGALSTQMVGAQANKLSRMAYSLDRPNLKTNGSPGDFTIISGGSHDVSVAKSAQHYVGRNFETAVGGNHSTRVQGNSSRSVRGDVSENVGKTRTEFVGDRYVLVVGQSRIEMRKNGEIRITGSDISLEGADSITLKAPRIDLN